VYFRLTSYNIRKKSVTFEEPNLHRRLVTGFTYTLPIGTKQVSVTVAGVVYDFIINQANDIYVSILNENGYPVFASIINTISGFSERVGLPLSGHAAYQQTKGSRPGQSFELKVEYQG
jgi:hypothetical protein